MPRENVLTLGELIFWASFWKPPFQPRITFSLVTSEFQSTGRMVFFCPQWACWSFVMIIVASPERAARYAHLEAPSFVQPLPTPRRMDRYVAPQHSRAAAHSEATAQPNASQAACVVRPPALAAPFARHAPEPLLRFALR